MIHGLAPRLYGPLVRHELRKRIEGGLADHRAGVLSTNGTGGAWAVPVRYRADGLEIAALLPSWTDVAFFAGDGREVLLVIDDEEQRGRRWIQYRGTAHVDDPSGDRRRAGVGVEHRRYLTVRLHPTRIDLIDERRGWGVLESLEIT